MELELTKLVPEIIVLVAACVAVLVGLARTDAVRKMAQIVALLGTGLGLAACFAPGSITWIDNSYRTASGNVFSPWFISVLAMSIGFLSVLVAWNMPAKSDPSVTDTMYRGEFFAMMLFSIAGVSMVGKVNDLVWLFVVLELVSIPTYIMVATSRNQIIAQEAGVKYFFLGALSAAVYLFGFSYLYGFSGATRFDQITAAFVTAAGNGGPSFLALIGLIMVLVGVSYKMAAVPLHFYAPDVYQGAATPVTAFLAFAPKAAGLVAIIQTLALFKFDYANLGRAGQSLVTVLTIMAVLTMTVGNVLALLQRNIKRMLAYSSIAHSGYMLAAVVVGIGAFKAGSTGIDAAMFYLAAYSIMNLGAFAVLIYLQGKADAGENIDDLAGVSKEHPAAALAMAICLLSLIGMPGTVGFIGKLKIVQAALGTNHAWLAVIIVINAAIAAAYYLRVIAAMYLRDVWNPFSVRREFPQRLAGIVCTLAVLVFGISPNAITPPAGAVPKPLVPVKTAAVLDMPVK